MVPTEEFKRNVDIEEKVVSGLTRRKEKYKMKGHEFENWFVELISKMLGDMSK